LDKQPRRFPILPKLKFCSENSGGAILFLAADLFSHRFALKRTCQTGHQW